MANRNEFLKKKEDLSSISKEQRNKSVERDKNRDRDRSSRHDYRRHERRHSPQSSYYKKRTVDHRYRYTSHDSRRRDKYRRSRSRTRSPPVKSRYRSNIDKNRSGSSTIKSETQSLSTEIKLPTFKPKVVLCEKKDDKPITKLWAATTFEQDDSGKMASKFKRLMGLKEGEVSQGSNLATTRREVLKKQAELFNNMEHQYEVARTTTHTMRGVGLGFAK